LLLWTNVRSPDSVSGHVTSASDLQSPSDFRQKQPA
jgi:hypothetical protein